MRTSRATPPPVAFVVLSGDETLSRDTVARLFGPAEIIRVSRNELRPRAIVATVRRLRSRRVGALAFFTISVPWQHRRIALLLVGAAAGARRTLILDGRGLFDSSRARTIFLEAPLALLDALLAPLLVLSDVLARTVLDALCRWRVPATVRVVAGDGRPERWLYVLQVPASMSLESGASSHVRGVLEALSSAGIPTRVVSFGEVPQVRPDDLRSEVAWRPSGRFNTFPRLNERFNNLLWLVKMWRLTGCERPDVVYQRHARYAWAAVAVTRLRRIPLALEFNESEVRAGAGWNGLARTTGVRRAEAFCLRHATVVSCVSVELEALARSASGGIRNTFVNPNGVELAHFGATASVASRRRDWPGFEASVVVGFVGTFMPYHGVETLAEAIRLLGGEGNLRFLLIGDGSLRPAVAATLEREVTDGVVAFTGRVSYEELPSMLEAVDVCVAPYVAFPAGEAFVNSPIKVLEYMAAGRAIVASDLGQIRQLLGGGAGVLVRAGDEAALAEAIGRLARDETLREELGAAARREAGKYSWDSHLGRVIEAMQAAAKA